MNKVVHERPVEKLSKYIHINPKRGNILVDQLSPVVVMKKVKLGPSDASGLVSVTDFLPELTDAEEHQDLESQRVRREEDAVKRAGVQNEEVSFLNTLTQDELNDHVQTCLEMSSENKINQKNAFALKLIDCFSFLQRKRDFSAMACTLDAGTKIYSCRVDALHQQVVKLADEVVTNIGQKKTDMEDKDGETGSKKSAKEQRKARKNKFIASSETLTRKMKAKDPKEKYLRFEALPGAILSGARRDWKDLSLSLERYTTFWPNWENYKPLRAEGVVSLPDIKIFREKPQSGISETPQIFSDLDKLQSDMKHSSDDDHDFVDQIFEDSSVSEEFVIVDVPVGESNSRDDHGVTDDKEDKVCSNVGMIDEADVVLTAMGRLKEEAEADGAVNRAPTRVEALKILFDESSEYNYLKMKNCNYWAGPEFWKRPKGLNENVKEKRVVNKKKEPANIVYDFKDLDERLHKLGKKATSLTERTVRSWKNKKTTLPLDLKVDLSWFLNLFHVENSGGKPEEFSGEQKPPRFIDVLENFEDAEGITDDSNDPFTADHGDISSSPDPLNATFYEAASGQSVNSDPRDPLDSTFYDPGPSNKESGQIIRVEVSTSISSEFGESSMVPVPKMVNVDPIKYSTRPIRVDMQHLKQSMLEVITEEIEKDARQKTLQRGPDDPLGGSKPEVRFRDVLKILPRKLERRTREDLSTAIAFTAVLSLTNENNLQLKKSDDGDFVVRLPDLLPALVSGEYSNTRSLETRFK